MCDHIECLTDGDIRDLSSDGSFAVKIGYIDDKPFSAIIVDTRSDEHLHFPYNDVLPSLR